MRRFWIVCLLIIGSLTACATTAPEPEAGNSPTTQPSPAQNAAQAHVAQTLGLQPADVIIKETEAMDWPDGCLGFSLPNVRCIQVVTPGFRVMLEAQGETIEARTNADGSVVFSTLDTLLDEPAMPDTPAEAARQSLAAALGLAVEQVEIVSSEANDWPNSCLGVANPGFMCAEVITPGYFVILRAEGRQYEYHTNADGSQLVPATRALTWSRQGGIAGFCDELVVYLPNEVYMMSCTPTTTEGQGALDVLLSAEELSQFNAWLDTYGSVTITRQDPAVADAMTVSLTLFGRGADQPDAAMEQTLLDWAQMLQTRMQP